MRAKLALNGLIMKFFKNRANDFKQLTILAKTSIGDG